MPTIEYRRSRPEDCAEILEVLTKGKGARAIEAYAATFDWKYGGQNPHDDGRPPFWVVTVDGAIGGVNGLMPAKIRYRGERLLAVWSCDTAVLARHRGQGLGKGLLTRLSAEAEVVLGYGIGDMSDPILSRLGWELEHPRGLFFYVAEKGAKGFVKNMRSSVVRFALGRTRAGGIDVTARTDGVLRRRGRRAVGGQRARSSLRRRARRRLPRLALRASPAAPLRGVPRAAARPPRGRADRAARSRRVGDCRLLRSRRCARD